MPTVTPAPQPPYVMQGSAGSPVVNHSAILFRRALTGIMSEGVATMNGVNDLKVSAGTGTVINIARGGGYIEGDSVTDQGMYFVYNDQNQSMTLSSGGSTRTDLIVAELKDSFYGDATNTWQIRSIDGTPGVPSTPSSAIPLASVVVNNNGTLGTITDLRVGAGATPAPGSITAAMIANGIITNAHLGDGIVTTQKWKPSIDQAFNVTANWPVPQSASVYTDVPGATLALNPGAFTWRAIVFAQFMVRGVVSTTDEFHGAIAIDGTKVSTDAILDSTGSSTGSAGSPGLAYYHKVDLAAGSHTFKLVARKGGSGACTLDVATNLLVIGFKA